MKALLFKPYPANFTLKRIHTNAWISFFIVFFILFFIQPFRLDELPTTKVLVYAFYYAVICPLVIYSIELFGISFFKSYYSEKNWHVLKQMIHISMILIGIAFGNLLVFHFIFNTPINISSIFLSLYYVVIIGMFPIAFGTIVTQYLYQKKYSRIATVLNEQIEKRAKVFQKKTERSETIILNSPRPEDKNLVLPERIMLNGQGSSEQLEVLINELVCITAADNYVDIYYLDKQIMQKKVFRTTLSAISQKILAYPQFSKCHRSYVINKQFILSSTGNAQGLKLRLDGIKFEVPVSRTFIKTFLS